MRSVETLLAEAITRSGSQSALARALGITPGDVNDMSRGRRPITAQTVGLLCDLLEIEGEEARRLAAEAIIATAKPEKQSALRRAFFDASETGASSGEAATERDEMLTRYTLSRVAVTRGYLERRSHARGTRRSDARGSAPAPRWLVNEWSIHPTH